MSGIVWGRRLSQYPVRYGFCPSKKAWDIELKRMKVRRSDNNAYLDSGAALTLFHDTPFGKTMIVTVSEGLDKRSHYSPLTVAMVIVHEAVHVWQRIREHIGEDAPGRECEAYAIQAISQEMIAAYCDTRRKIL